MNWKIRRGSDVFEAELVSGPDKDGRVVVRYTHPELDGEEVVARYHGVENGVPLYLGYHTVVFPAVGDL